MSGNAFKVLSVLILAPGNNAELRFLGEFQHEKNFYFWFFFGIWCYNVGTSGAAGRLYRVRPARRQFQSSGAASRIIGFRPACSPPFLGHL